MIPAPNLQDAESNAPAVFIANGCDGPCLASAAARKRMGVEAGQMVQIFTERGDMIHRRVNKIPQAVVKVAQDDYLWLNFADLRLLCITIQDKVFVVPSDCPIESP